MKTRKFLIYSIIYIIAVGVFVYSFNNTNYTFELLGWSIDLPVAVWFMLPVTILAILAVIHIFYHSFGFYRYKRSIKKDASLYNDMAKEILLGLESNKEFKTHLYKIPSQIIRALSPWDCYKEVGIDDSELSLIMQSIRSVKNKDVVDLKKFKLPKENALMIQNELNKIEKIPNYYFEILKNQTDRNYTLVNAAYDKLIKTASYDEIKRVGFSMSSDEIMLIINRFINDEIDITPDEIFELLDNVKITKAQYDKAAVILKNKLKPDAYMSIFEKLKAIHADADEAYVYVLYELQMLDKVREAIQTSDPDELKEIKVLLFLRDNGKIVPSSLFFK
ncbi:MAG: LapA family protein [Campylobacter sp.]|nr:LapA family protein [Campylobacter sp.]